jgi:hypothetical protein
MEWDEMDTQKISLDIRTILAQLNIDFERFTEWENNKQAGVWEKTEWLELECSDDTDEVAVAQS